MATRREVEQRRVTLRNDLRDTFLKGSLAPGEILPSIRELAARYRVSASVARQVVLELLAEGRLYTVPGVGTFVGRQPILTSEFYLLLLPASTYLAGNFERWESCTRFQRGFEERIAQLGGTSLAVQRDMALQCREKGELPALAGVFDIGDETEPSWNDVPGVRFVIDKSVVQIAEGYDLVSFDDLDGGRQATQHLLSLGHRQIAYLAAHPQEGVSYRCIWSEAREQGWRQTLEAADLPIEGQAFHPACEPLNQNEIFRVSRVTARALLGYPEITAVVAANDYAAMGLIATLRDMQIPPELWPAVVGFDNLPSAQPYLLSSLRLPLEEIGNAAADLLWQRRHGRLTGPPVHRFIPMRLVPRLTSRTGWPLIESMVDLVSAEQPDEIPL